MFFNCIIGCVLWECICKLCWWLSMRYSYWFSGTLWTWAYDMTLTLIYSVTLSLSHVCNSNKRPYGISHVITLRLSHVCNSNKRPYGISLIGDLSGSLTVYSCGWTRNTIVSIDDECLLRFAFSRSIVALVQYLTLKLVHIFSWSIVGLFTSEISEISFLFSHLYFNHDNVEKSLHFNGMMLKTAWFWVQGQWMCSSCNSSPMLISGFAYVLVYNCTIFIF